MKIVGICEDASTRAHARVSVSACGALKPAASTYARTRELFEYTRKMRAHV